MRHHVKDMRADTTATTCQLLLTRLVEIASQDTVTPRWSDVDCPVCLQHKPTLFVTLTALRDRLEAQEQTLPGEFHAGYAQAVEGIVDDLDQILADYQEA